MQKSPPRSPCSRSRSPRGRKLREGDKCEARFRGKSSAKMYPGKVTRIHGDGSIDVRYDDGDSDRNLKPSHVSWAQGAIGAGPVPAARRGAACASARAWRLVIGTDSASKLQLPSFTFDSAAQGS